MSGKLLWIGGVHGVGKSSAIDSLSSFYNLSLKRVHMGTLIFNCAQKLGFGRISSTEENKLYESEELAAQMIIENLRHHDLVLDGHFCIYLDGTEYPGFHANNIDSVVLSTSKTALINIVAGRNAILERRKFINKHHYPTRTNVSLIDKELSDSLRYFNYFSNSSRRPVNISTIDNTNIDAQMTAREVIRVYDEIRN